MSDGPDSEPCGPAAVVNGIRQDCAMGVWDNAFEEAEGPRFEELVVDNDPHEAFAHGADWAVCWLAAIIGLGHGVRGRKWKCPTCRCRISIMFNTCACCGPDWSLCDDEKQL